jgi:hypothetical protein
MPGYYNARDAEYVPGESACVHFTTLHTQPWRPLPEWFVYDRNPTGSLWFELEREADEAAFMPVSALRPSSAWPDAALRLSARSDGPELRELLGVHEENAPSRARRTVTGVLEQVPDPDLPWVLARLFARTRDLVIRVEEPILIRSGAPRRSLHFWTQQLQLAERSHPETRWRFERRVGMKRRVIAGGSLRDGPVALLSRPSIRARSKAEAIGTMLARKTGRDLIRIGMPRNLLGGAWRAVTGRGVFDLQEPPAVLIASGALATRAARRAAARSSEPPALVLIGRHVGRVPEHGGVAISMLHHRLPPHPRRITTLLGFGHRDDWRPAADPGAWKHWLDRDRRCALLVGRHPAGAWSASESRKLTEQALAWAERRGARLLIVTTSDSRSAAETARDHAGERADVYAWDADEGANPYGLALHSAHALLVAGGSPGVLQDALASARPVYLVPDPTRPGPLQRLAARIAARAFRPSYNKRGSVRPQQGVAYLCARLVERGWVVPPTGLTDWQRTLVERGLAAWIGLRSGAGVDRTAARCGGRARRHALSLGMSGARPRIDRLSRRRITSGLIIFCLLGAIGTGAAFASEIYRCEGADSIVFSDVPCSQSAEIHQPRNGISVVNAADDLASVSERNRTFIDERRMRIAERRAQAETARQRAEHAQRTASTARHQEQRALLWSRDRFGPALHRAPASGATSSRTRALQRRDPADDSVRDRRRSLLSRSGGNGPILVPHRIRYQ